MSKIATGRLIIVSAPSGAGKTSLVKQITQNLDHLVVSISHTTRQKRPGEVDGVDYYFVSIDEFKAMLSQQAFLEHAKVFDNFYGTAKNRVEARLNDGKDVILEIDWQGAQQIREMLPDCITVFILPPSRTILEQRLRNRGQDCEETIRRRMTAAVSEMSHYDEYDYLIVNEQLEQAAEQLKTIIESRGAQFQSPENLETLLQNLLN